MKKKILLVEDEKVLTDLYVEKLISSGFEVISTKEAEEGVKLIKSKKPDLVLLDILLPKENGIYLLEQLKKMAKTNVPVVVFSNYDDEDTKEKAAELGAKEYIIKTNHTPTEVVNKLKEYL